MFGSVGPMEILLVLLIVVFLFGARRIPEIARGLGEGIRNFRSSLKGADEPPTDAAKHAERPDRKSG